ncbi:MAG: hypothetical protein LBE61_22415 [Burkholderiaceae bacterium]|nr:hypothetical protein [Burkholderiaceae bacterium]
MNDYILFMHHDAADTDAASDPDLWARYLARLRDTGLFDGGSAIGSGERLRKGTPDRPCDDDLSGFVRVRAESLSAARELLLPGNPVYEAGGTVELRELPRS